MKLTLDPNDLKPEFLNRVRDGRPSHHLHTMNIRFDMFLPTTQKAIRVVGRGLYVNNVARNEIMIYPSN